MKRKIVQCPDKVLTNPVKSITLGLPDDREQMMTYEGVIELAKDLCDTMADLKWGKPVGLAAPQIGRPVAMFIALGEVFINPIITKCWSKSAMSQEMCYSLPRGQEVSEVQRWKRVQLEWMDINLNPKQRTFHRFDAVVIQHEFDHLIGLLCTDPGKRKYLNQRTAT